MSSDNSSDNILHEYNIPQELDDHFKNFGKYSNDVDYNRYGYCVFCNSRIDEFDYCACIGGTPD